MSTFTPPVSGTRAATYVDAAARRRDPVADQLFAHYAGTSYADNVFLLTDGTVTTEYPATTYNADGTIDDMPTARIARAFWGAHGSFPVNASETSLLEGAGYTVDA